MGIFVCLSALSSSYSFVSTLEDQQQQEQPLKQYKRRFKLTTKKNNNQQVTEDSNYHFPLPFLLSYSTPLGYCTPQSPILILSTWADLKLKSKVTNWRAGCCSYCSFPAQTHLRHRRPTSLCTESAVFVGMCPIFCIFFFCCLTRRTVQLIRCLIYASVATDPFFFHHQLWPFRLRDNKSWHMVHEGIIERSFSVVELRFPVAPHSPALLLVFCCYFRWWLRWWSHTTCDWNQTTKYCEFLQLVVARIFACRRWKKKQAGSSCSTTDLLPMSTIPIYICKDIHVLCGY